MQTISLITYSIHSLNSKLPGSETRLYPHQVIGVSWMHDLEKNVARRGGILACASASVLPLLTDN